MPTPVNRQTVDLSCYPDLIVLYLGMRVNHLYGIRTFFSFGRKISESVKDETGGSGEPVEVDLAADERREPEQIAGRLRDASRPRWRARRSTRRRRSGRRSRHPPRR